MSRDHVTETVIVGGGQAGLALSRELTNAGRRHVVLERGRVGERWRSERWESLTLLTPAWASTLPGQAVAGDPDSYPARDRFVAGLEDHAASFAAPVAEGVAVVGVERSAKGFRVSTSRGAWSARNVVVATGDCDLPLLPDAVRSVPPGALSLHSSRYVAPDRLPDGGVLVVGAGSSGQQLALELARAGRTVTIAAGRHARLPRRYRGRDVWHWIDELGDFDVTIDAVPDPVAARRAPSVTLTGMNGERTSTSTCSQRAGVVVTGRLEGFWVAAPCSGAGSKPTWRTWTGACAGHSIGSTRWPDLRAPRRRPFPGSKCRRRSPRSISAPRAFGRCSGQRATAARTPGSASRCSTPGARSSSVTVSHPSRGSSRSA